VHRLTKDASFLQKMDDKSKASKQTELFQ
jgi:hypothetical protein